MFSIEEKRNKFFLLQYGEEVTINNKKLIFDHEEEGRKFLKKVQKLQTKICFEILGLFYFSSKLTNENVKEIIKIILEQLVFDNMLYLSSHDQEVNKIVINNYKNFVKIFETRFKLKFKLQESSIGYQTKIMTRKFETYLKNLNNDSITLFYKLTKLTNSPILTYLFYEKILDDVKFFNVSNFEDKYNEKKWGITDEKLKVKKDLKKTFKILSNFFRLII